VFYTGRFIFKGLNQIGHHPPIVSMELFSQAQGQLKKACKPDYTHPTIAFSGLITCGHCGCSVTGDVKQKGRYVYYRCTHHKQKCPDKYIREEALQEQFAAMVAQFTVTDEQQQWMLNGLKSINATKDQEMAERTTRINEEITRIRNRMSQMYEDKLDGVIDAEMVTRRSKEGLRRMGELEGQLNRLNNAGYVQMTLGLQILEFA
jgi:site-specific DNA recombinase